jgi:hypothetical protein
MAGLMHLHMHIPDASIVQHAAFILLLSRFSFTCTADTDSVSTFGFGVSGVCSTESQQHRVRVAVSPLFDQLHIHQAVICIRRGITVRTVRTVRPAGYTVRTYA